MGATATATTMRSGGTKSRVAAETPERRRAYVRLIETASRYVTLKRAVRCTFQSHSHSLSSELNPIDVVLGQADE